MAVSEEEAKKKARNAFIVMMAVEVIAFILFWLIQQMLHNPNLAFAVLIMGGLIGAGYYIYEVRKLKDTH